MADGRGPKDEAEAWRRVTDRFEDVEVRLGQHWSYNLLHDPKRLAFVLSRYKFAARLATVDLRVLELGCSEGMGALLLGEFAQSYTGVDLDREAIDAARRNFGDPRYTFVCDDFMSGRYGTFDTIVSMDVIEHIEPAREPGFFACIMQNLAPDGCCIVGTPNVTAAAYQSAASAAGHVNLFGGDRLRSTLERYFHNVFLFGMNDEVVHTGFTPMAHFLIAVCVYPREAHP